MRRRSRNDKRNERIAAGLCGKCGADRGKYGTSSMCRPCADHKAERVRNSREATPNHVRDANGFITLECENCFIKFPWEGSGQRTMCDDCLPWFADNFDELSQQKAANRVKPVGHIPVTSNRVINRWQKQGW